MPLRISVHSGRVWGTIAPLGLDPSSLRALSPFQGVSSAAVLGLGFAARAHAASRRWD
jgi:hypothetical protein